MEQVSVPLSEKTIFTKEKNRLPLTKEAILSLNDGTVSFEEARALFNVDLSTFQKILEDFNIFVWKNADGTLKRIHVGDYLINLYIKMRGSYYFFIVPSTISFEDVRSEIENCFKLSPGCYKLSFKHRSKLVSVSVKTDRDWHFVVLFSKRRAYHVYLDLEYFPFSQTADEVAWYDGADLYEAASDEDFYASDEDASDEDACNVFVEGACDENSMEQVSVPLSEKTIIHPFTKERLPFTEETILSLNNGTMGFEEAGALLNVDLSTFKAILEQLNIFVWKEGDGKLLRIHGGDYAFKVVIKDMRGHYAVKPKYHFTVSSTLSFEAVKSMIEERLKLSPGCYKLTNQSIGKDWVKTDRDWHFVFVIVVLISSNRIQMSKFQFHFPKKQLYIPFDKGKTPLYRGNNPFAKTMETMGFWRKRGFVEWDMRGTMLLKAQIIIFTVSSTLSFEAVKSMIEERLKLSPGCYNY
ncbi:hypothetical protein CTI12_AA054510 [Artemisia annua]|uniref:Uncharacterized protein n=1 Tax=Artemisia annua TaxID=35608 RepID=A0A2U1QAB5_ARTAN|nr:hypothetical protein CTI12_AA054510 [Artemisia annua]